MGCLGGYLRTAVFLYVVLSLSVVSYALECKDAKKGFINLLTSPKSCPTRFDDNDDTFCCERSDGSIYCCDFDEFAKSNGVEYLIPVAIGIVVGILAGCFLCCLCCPCCMLYKRRHQGTVYGRVQQPQTVVSVQTYGPTSGGIPHQGHVPMPQPSPMPMPMPQPGVAPMPQPQVPPYPMYQGAPGEYSGQPQVPPPPYSAVTNEGYAKQAPYNPNFYNN